MHKYTRSFLALLLVVLITHTARAQQKMITVKGIVYEKGSSQPLPGIAFGRVTRPKALP